MQIEEICRLENLTRDEQIDDGDRADNQLMPTDDSLAATLFIALPQDEHLKERLAQLVGLDEHVDPAHRPARDPRRVRARALDRGASISAVQYTRYPLIARGQRGPARPRARRSRSRSITRTIATAYNAPRSCGRRSQPTTERRA